MLSRPYQDSNKTLSRPHHACRTLPSPLRHVRSRRVLDWAGRNGILGLLKGEARDAVSCNLLSWSGLAKAGARAGSASHGGAHPNTATALRLRDPVGARLSPSRSNTGYARLPDVPRRNPLWTDRKRDEKGKSVDL